MGIPQSTVEASTSGTVHLQAEGGADAGSTVATFVEDDRGNLEAGGSEEGRRASPHSEDWALARSDVVQRATAPQVLGRWAQLSSDENLECRDV